MDISRCSKLQTKSLDFQWSNTVSDSDYKMMNIFGLINLEANCSNEGKKIYGWSTFPHHFIMAYIYIM